MLTLCPFGAVLSLTLVSFTAVALLPAVSVKIVLRVNVPSVKLLTSILFIVSVAVDSVPVPVKGVPPPELLNVYEKLLLTSPPVKVKLTES